MLFIRLWNRLLGYLVIKVDGLSLEKFINLCVSRNIKLWSIKRNSYTSMTACISIKGFKSLPAIVRKVGCRVKILDKRGFPFLAHRFKHRKMLIAGMVIFLVILYGLSSFVWVVEVEGNVKVRPEVIYEILEEKGIKPGVYKGKLNSWDIENEILIGMPELSWISIELKGTKAIVRVVERAKPPKLINKGTPCNIVATKDGIINKLTILEGKSLVEVGETVREGQLLISGIIDHEDTQTLRYVHANAEVLARTWYEGNGLGEYDKVSQVRTGRKVSFKQIETEKWEIQPDKDIPFDRYEVVETKEPILGFDNILGFSLITRDYYEVQESSVEDYDRLAKKMAEEEAVRNALENVPKGAKIIDKKYKYDIIKGKGYRVIVYIEILEDIGKQVEISTN